MPIWLWSDKFYANDLQSMPLSFRSIHYVVIKLKRLFQCSARANTKCTTRPWYSICVQYKRPRLSDSTVPLTSTYPYWSSVSIFNVYTGEHFCHKADDLKMLQLLLMYLLANKLFLLYVRIDNRLRPLDGIYFCCIYTRTVSVMFTSSLYIFFFGLWKRYYSSLCFRSARRTDCLIELEIILNAWLLLVCISHICNRQATSNQFNYQPKNYRKLL